MGKEGEMSWRIIMIEEGEYMRLKLDNLHVQKGTKEYTIPLSDISMIIISNLDTVLTSRLLDAFTSYNIGLVVCDYKHHPSGIFHPLNTHSRASKIFRLQLEWTEEFKEYTWSYIVRSKIINQRDVLKKYTKEEDSIDLLSSYVEEIALGDVTNREGHAAKVYFNTLFGKDFTRAEESDVRNACLNYGYTIIRAFFARLIVAYGLSGMVGLHHKSEYNNFNLVDDLMEPFRPIYDDYLLQQIDNATIFDFETRYYIIDFLNQPIHYRNKSMIMMNVMEKYVQYFMKYCSSKEIEEVHFPMVE